MKLLDLARTLGATDITNKSLDEIKDINRVEIIHRRFGINGMNGLIFRDKEGKFFLIRERCTNLFYFS